MERFHSLQDKLLLLDEAVALHDGNVITAVSPAPMYSSGGREWQFSLTHLISISVHEDVVTFILLFFINYSPKLLGSSR